MDKVLANLLYVILFPLKVFAAGLKHTDAWEDAERQRHHDDVAYEKWLAANPDSIEAQARRRKQNNA